MQPCSGQIAKVVDKRGQVERHIESAFGSRHTTTNHESQLRGLGVDFTERKSGEKPSKHGRDQLQQLYSHEFKVFLRIDIES